MARLAAGLYAFLLNLYSRRFRAEFAREMQAVFAVAAPSPGYATMRLPSTGRWFIFNRKRV
jgi:hypothetical protein